MAARRVFIDDGIGMLIACILRQRASASDNEDHRINEQVQDRARDDAVDYRCCDTFHYVSPMSAPQYILGPFGADSALRDYGLRLAQRGNSQGQEAGRRRRRTKARRIAPHALEIP